MKLEVGKQYKTESGKPARVVVTDFKNPHIPPNCAIVLISTPQGHEQCRTYPIDGSAMLGEENLVEVGPYEDFKIDDPVLVWDGDIATNKLRRYFAGINPNNGKPMAFAQGGTQWSSGIVRDWDHCERAEK